MQAQQTSQSSLLKGNREKLLTLGFALAGAATLIVAGLILAGKRFMWMDELLTWQIVTTPSWGAMLHVIADQVDTMPPFYFIVARTWLAVTGETEFALRLLSILLTSTAFVTMFMLIKRTAGIFAAVAASSVFLLSGTLFHQLTEARYYPLLVLLTAVATTMLFTGLERSRVSKGWLAANTLVHGLLVTTHIFGFLYSASLILSGLVFVKRGRNDAALRITLSALAGWILFLPWIPSQLYQMQVGEPWSWMPVPDLMALLRMPFEFVPAGRMRYVLPAAFILMVLAPHRLWPRIRMGLLQWMTITGVLLAFLPVVTSWVLSNTVVSIFTERYFSPGIIGWMLLLPAFAEWIRRVLPERMYRASSRVFILGLSILTVILLSFPAVKALQIPPARPPGSLEAALYPDLPVVTESPHAYLPRHHYSANRDRIFYVLDSLSAFDRSGALNGPTDFHHMLAIKRNFRGQNILSGDSILHLYPRFLLVDENDRLWSERVIERNPDYELRQITPSLTLVLRKNGK